MDQQLSEALQHKINQKTKPIGALGRLETLAFKIGMMQETTTPVLRHPTILVFAADHGISASGVSPYPKDVTWQMVLNFLSGGAAINVFARQNGVNLKVVDAGVDHDFEPHKDLIQAKIAYGTHNMLEAPAMTLDVCQQAMEKGKMLAEDELARGCNIIGFGEMGIGNTSSAALLMSKFCHLPVEECAGKGTGLDEAGLKHKVEILKKVLQRHHNVREPVAILAALGGLEIAMMVGAMLEAAAQKMIIMVDGFIATSALLAARAINKHVLKYCIFCHQSDEHGHAAMLQTLEAEPILKLNMRLGEGTGVALAYPIVEAAVNFLNEMASFESAGVSNK